MMKRIPYVLLLLCAVLNASTTEKVLIITHAFARPEFIEIQHKTFKKFLEDPYEYVVFDDAKTEEMSQQIKSMCALHDIRYIRIPQDIHTRPYLPRLPSEPLQRNNVRHANNVQYSCDILGFDHEGIVVILDSDMFLIRPFSITQHMRDKDVSAYVKTAPKGIRCICPALSILHMDKLPNRRSMNFNCGFAEGDVPVDSGGWTHYYFKQHPSVNVHEVSVIKSEHLYCGRIEQSIPVDTHTPEHVKRDTYQQHGFNEREIQFLLKQPNTFEFYLDKYFLHYSDGSNCYNKTQDFHAHKARIFKEFIDAILSDEH